jgi:hypothetical protein
LLSLTTHSVVDGTHETAFTLLPLSIVCVYDGNAPCAVEVTRVLAALAATTDPPPLVAVTCATSLCPRSVLVGV